MESRRSWPRPISLGRTPRTIRRNRARTRQLQQLLHARGTPLRVLPGADVRIDAELAGKLQQDEVLTLAQPAQARCLLLELPHELYFPREPLLDQLIGAGGNGRGAVPS